MVAHFADDLILHLDVQNATDKFGLRAQVVARVTLTLERRIDA
jgi:hypothetical protein